MYICAIRSSSIAVSIGKKLGIGPRLSLLLSLNRGGRVRSLRLSASLMQALYILILSPSVARPIWNHRSLQQLHISIHLAYSILLNFLIRSQSTAKTGYSIAEARAYYKECSISTKVGIGAKVGISARVGIGARVGIRASPSKDTFRPS